MYANDTFPRIVAISMLYGAHFILFLLSVHILQTTTRTGKQWLLFSTILLFILSTVNTGLYLALSHDLSTGSLFPSFSPSYFSGRIKILVILCNIFPLVSFMTADAVLIHRCYLIWQRCWKTVSFPIVLLLASFVLGVLSVFHNVIKCVLRYFYSLSLATNILVTCLSAGRIMWISRKAAGLLDQGIRDKYTTTISIILESGMGYCAVLAVNLAVYARIASELDEGKMPDSRLIVVYNTLYPISALFAGIVPTLLIVRIGMGYGISCADAASTTGCRNIQDRGVDEATTTEIVTRTDTDRDTHDHCQQTAVLHSEKNLDSFGYHYHLQDQAGRRRPPLVLNISPVRLFPDDMDLEAKSGEREK